MLQSKLLMFTLLLPFNNFISFYYIYAQKLPTPQGTISPQSQPSSGSLPSIPGSNGLGGIQPDLASQGGKLSPKFGDQNNGLGRPSLDPMNSGLAPGSASLPKFGQQPSASPQSSQQQQPQIVPATGGQSNSNPSSSSNNHKNNDGPTPSSKPSLTPSSITQDSSSSNNTTGDRSSSSSNRSSMIFNCLNLFGNLLIVLISIKVFY
nr:13223_t:CDS:1 [Entrophospora candida]